MIGKFMEDYHDDLTIHSKLSERHIMHLRQVFQHCRLYGISLNRRNHLFSVSKGNILGHIVSKERIIFDTDRFKTINNLQPLTSQMGF